MADNESVRQRIVSSVFSRRNAAGGIEESYRGHIKIWEQGQEGGDKPRYILLSEASNGAGFIHKSKLNANGTFSVGKTWRLEDLRAVRVINPQAFAVSFARSYAWQTESQVDQRNFVIALVDLFHTVTNGQAPLQVDGLDYAPPTISRRAVQDEQPRQESSRTPSIAQLSQGRRQTPTPRSQTPVQAFQVAPPSPAHSIKSRRDRLNSTASSVPSINLPPVSPTATISSLFSKESERQVPGPIRVPTALDVPDHRHNISAGFPLSAASTYSPLPSSDPNPPSRSASPTPSAASATRVLRRDPANARISFFDTANQAVLQQLVNKENDAGEEEGTLATMANVEEMLEEYEWASDDIIDRKIGTGAGGAADLIEARLLNELTALEKANIHSFLVGDNRVSVVCNYLDQAISELDNMENLVAGYKMHLNAVGDDISYIQSQRRGLQVQTQNQRTLLNELENLLHTVHVDTDCLLMLTQESLEKTGSIQRLEDAAAELYKALQAGRDTDMAATMERLDEYKTHNGQFCKRMFDFLSIMFTAQAKLLLGDGDGTSPPTAGGQVNVISHQPVEAYLGRYSGLMLYLREMDQKVYTKLCSAYFLSASDFYKTQLRALFTTYLQLIKEASDVELQQALAMTPTFSPSRSASGVRRAGTLIRSPIESRRDRDKEKQSEGVLRASEAFNFILDQLITMIKREEEFVTHFLHVKDTAYTFADHMRLDSYFQRQAARGPVLGQSALEVTGNAMDLIFTFLPAELKAWVDAVITKDRIEIIGILASLERFLFDADEYANSFLVSMLDKQHSRTKGLFERHLAEQIKGIEQTKLTSKKRQGIAPFIKFFPSYITRVENQLVGAEGLEIRTIVEGVYEKIVQAMFDALRHMAKLDGEGEDKSQLNYHVILIENMHHFAADMAQMEVGSVAGFIRRAQALYEENLNAYVKLVLRRPFAKLIDFFEGVDRMLKTTAPTEVSKNGNLGKSALKKVIKEFNAKDIRKIADVLFKRVEKHFIEYSEKVPSEDSGDPESVISGVWKACEEELVRITEVSNIRIAQCYSESGLSLEYSVADVEAAFRRHK